MAKMKLFSIYDSKIAAHMSFFAQAHTGQALRGFQEAANNPETMINRHPADFTLFEVAELDQESGEVTAYAKPVNLAVAAALMKRPAEAIPMPFDRPSSAPMQEAR